ncbi:MAG: hypothetical protein DWQ31_06865, partial [Planctomycetota bacterium]
MKRHIALFRAGAFLACTLMSTLTWAQPSPPVSGAGCNNTSYDGGYNPAPTNIGIQLCNDPIADGLFTEDGVTGYQYIYDYFTFSSCCGSYYLGGTVGPLGPAGTFQGDASAWYREAPSLGGGVGVWQTWSVLTVTDDGTSSHHSDPAAFGIPSAMVSDTVPRWTEADGAGLGNTVTDTWATDVTFNPNFTWFNDGGTSVVGDPIPWARDNVWHLPSEYGYTSEWKMQGVGFESPANGVTGSTGLAWQEITDVFQGGPLHLQATIRVVSPFEPGSINWGIAGDTGIVTGPNGAPVPQGPTSCLIGDVNCDGFVEIGADILTAFTNFTGP